MSRYDCLGGVRVTAKDIIEGKSFHVINEDWDGVLVTENGVKYIEVFGNGRVELNELNGDNELYIIYKEEFYNL